MIESKVLYKSYKTIRGYKIAMGRYKKDMLSELKDVQDWYDKGHRLYLGDHINKPLFELPWELERIDRELNKLTQ